MRSIIPTILLISLLFGCSRSVPPSAEKPLKAPAEYDRDIQLYAEVVARDSNNVQAWFSLGNAHLDKGKALEQDQYGDVSIAAIEQMQWAARAYDRGLTLVSNQLNDGQLEEIGEVYSSLKILEWYPIGGYQGEAFLRFGARVRKAARSNVGSARAWLTLSMFYPDYSLYEYCLRKAIEINPTFGEAYKALASAADGERKTTVYAVAFFRYSRLARLGSMNASELWDMANYYGNDQVRFSFMKSYGDSLKGVPPLIQAFFTPGVWLLMMSHANDKFGELVTRIMSVDTSNIRALYYSISRALNHRDTVRALEFYFRSRDTWSNQFFEGLYRKAIAVDPLFAPAYADLALVIKDKDSVVSLLQKAISLEKGNPSRLFAELSAAYRSKGNLDMAIFWEEKSYEELSRRGFPIYSTFFAFSRLASLYFQKEDVAAVRQLLQRGMSTEGVDPVRAVLFALTYDIDPRKVRMSDLEEMIETKLGLSSEHKALAYSNLAKAHQNDTLKQLKYFRRALDLDPSNEGARKYILTDEVKKGNYSKALMVLRQWRNAQTSFALGEELRENGKSKESSLFYSTANELDPDLAVEAFEEAKIFPAELKYSTEQYQKAARLGYKPARDSLRARNLSW